VIWAQIDANQHLRHSAYADLAAQARVQLLDYIGLKPSAFYANNLGPILFREELLYKKEIHMNEKISVSCELTKCKADASKWSILHHIYKENGEIAASVQVDGSWIDMHKRKTTGLPEKLLIDFMKIPKSENFQKVI